MPVPLRSIGGMIPYDVEQQIRDLTLAVNQLEQGSPVSAERIASIEGALTTLTDQINSLNSRLQSVTQQVTALQQP